MPLIYAPVSLTRLLVTLEVSHDAHPLPGVGRSHVRWPSQQFFDLSVQKNFAVGTRGRQRLQLRVDMITTLYGPMEDFRGLVTAYVDAVLANG